MKKYLIILVLSLIFFGFSSLYSYTDICCMFSASKYYGWPYPYLNLNKTVETLGEANLVKSLPAQELIKRGWKFNFSSDIVNSTPFGKIGNFIFDYLICLLLSWLVIYTLKRINILKP